MPRRAAFLDYLVASAQDFIFLLSDTAVKSITFSDELCLYVSNHFIRAFQMLDVGPMSPSLRACLPSCSVPVSLFGFLSLFSAPFQLRRRKGGSLDCETAQSTDVEIVRNLSVEWRRNLTKLRQGCFDERTGWGANHV